MSAETLVDGRYRLKTLLGEGGMGRVYEGEDLRLGRRVAIKVIADDAEQESVGERLFREAKAAARAEHPAVVVTYGYGSDPELGVSYVVMERLIGETIAQRIERVGPLSVELTLRIALAAADALHAVHEASIIHRDLKPSNIFLASRGLRVDDVKLLDFGVAKQLDLPAMTATGQVYGTLMYMPPEQLRDSKRVDARCDLYSLGAVLFECLSGDPPFAPGQAAAMASEILFGQVPRLCAARPSAPVAFARVIERCLSKRASERFPDARSLHAALSKL